MKLALKIIILFLIIFRFRIPVLFDTTFLSILLCSVYYLSTRRTLPFTYFFNRYIVAIFIGIFLMLWVYLFFTVAHHEYDYYFIISVVGFKITMLFALVYAIPILLEGEEKHSFESAAILVCYAFAIQGFIIFMAFLIPPFGDFMISIKNDALRSVLEDNVLGLSFRGYALAGTVFFELPAGFGVAWILFVRILSIKDQTFITGYKIYVIFVLLFIGSMFTGRTAFAGLIIAIVMGSMLMIKNLFSLILKNLAIMLAFAAFFAIFYTFLPTKQKQLLTGEVFHFAFEAYYSYETTGKLSTTSSDATINQHYYRLPDKTLLYGEGRYTKRGTQKGFYGDTDAGYMRNALFGGIPLILCLILYQLLYFSKPVSISWRLRNTEEAWRDFIVLIALFLHIFILEYKGSALYIMNIMEVLICFTGFSYIMRHYYREDNEID